MDKFKTIHIVIAVLTLGLIQACETFKEPPPKPKAKDPLVFIEEGLRARDYLNVGDGYNVAISSKLMKNETRNEIVPMGKATALSEATKVDPRAVLKEITVKTWLEMNGKKASDLVEIKPGMTAKARLDQKLLSTNPELPGVSYDPSKISSFDLDINYNISQEVSKSLRSDYMPKKVSYTQSVDDSNFLVVKEGAEPFDEDEALVKMRSVRASFKNFAEVSQGDDDRISRNVKSVSFSGSSAIASDEDAKAAKTTLAGLVFPDQFFIPTKNSEVEPTLIYNNVNISAKEGFTFYWNTDSDPNDFMSIIIFVKNEAYDGERDARKKFTMLPYSQTIVIDCIDDGSYTLSLSEGQIATLGLGEGAKATAEVMMTRYKPQRVTIGEKSKGLVMAGTGAYGFMTISN